MKKLFGILIVSISLVSCTSNSRVKTWGGEATFNLPKGEKLIMITWKEDQLWYLTKPMKVTDSAENYTFREESSFGLIEGTYNIVETK